MGMMKDQHHDTIVANSPGELYKAEQQDAFVEWVFNAGKYAAKLEQFNKDVEALCDESEAQTVGEKAEPRLAA